MTGWARDSKRENKMTDEQHEQWLKDVELLGDNAYKMWEYCLMEDEKNGKYWRSPLKNSHHVLKKRECRRIADAHNARVDRPALDELEK